MRLRTHRPKHATDANDRKAFRELVKLQDNGMSVPDSRAKVMAEFNLTMEVLLQIERDGINRDWSPL